MAFEFNPFTGSLDSVGLSQASADARYVLKVAGSFSGLTGAGFRDTSAAFDVTLGFTSSAALTAARALTLDVVNASRSIKLAGNVDLGGNFTTTGSGTLALGGFTLTVPATGTAALLGMANVFTAVQTLPAGTVGAPALTFGDATTGLYRSAANELAATVSGVRVFKLSANGKFAFNYTNVDGILGSLTSVYGTINIRTGGGSEFYVDRPLGTVGDNNHLQLLSDFSHIRLGLSSDLRLVRKAANALQLGTDAAGVTNQMFTAASRITSDGVGANLTIAGGNGRGGAGGSLIFSYYTTAAAATIGTLTEAMRITTTGAIILAALPTSDPGVSGQLYKSAGVVMQSA